MPRRKAFPGTTGVTDPMRLLAFSHRCQAQARVAHHENRTVPCASWLKALVAGPIAAEGYRVFELPSGAGQDGMAMIDIADVGMVSARCRGISHHPDEHVDKADVDAGARMLLLRFIENFRPRNVESADV
jgi:allantoate deiminase